MEVGLPSPIPNYQDHDHRMGGHNDFVHETAGGGGFFGDSEMHFFNYYDNMNLFNDDDEEDEDFNENEIDDED